MTGRLLLLLFLCVIPGNLASLEKRGEGWNLLTTLPHDTSCFTEGLFFLNSTAVVESCGLNGISKITLTDLKHDTRTVLAELPSQYFGEGIQLYRDKLFILTYKAHEILVFDFDEKRLEAKYKGSVSYPEWEGWGLTFDRQGTMYATDGSADLIEIDAEKLYELSSNPPHGDETYPYIVRRINVDPCPGSTVAAFGLNELEYVPGTNFVLANQFMTSNLLLIDVQEGKCVESAAITSLYDGPGDVMNGIAWIEEDNLLELPHSSVLITGKHWDSMFALEMDMITRYRPVERKLGPSESKDSGEKEISTEEDDVSKEEDNDDDLDADDEGEEDDNQKVKDHKKGEDDDEVDTTKVKDFVEENALEDDNQKVKDHKVKDDKEGEDDDEVDTTKVKDFVEESPSEDDNQKVKDHKVKDDKEGEDDDEIDTKGKEVSHKEVLNKGHDHDEGRKDKATLPRSAEVRPPPIGVLGDRKEKEGNDVFRPPTKIVDPPVDPSVADASNIPPAASSDSGEIVNSPGYHSELGEEVKSNVDEGDSEDKDEATKIFIKNPQSINKQNVVKGDSELESSVNKEVAHIIRSNLTPKSKWLTWLAEGFGVIYMACWLISFYPQFVLNCRRKSATGFSFDLVVYNIVGYACYSAYCIVRYVVEKQYDLPTAVEIHDVLFSCHALLICLGYGVQICIYDRGNQHVGAWCKWFIFLVLVGAGTNAALASFHIIPWYVKQPVGWNLDVDIFTEAIQKVTAGKSSVAASSRLLSAISVHWVNLETWSFIQCMGFIKLFINIIKYLPQIVLNCRRKSTEGLSNCSVLLDFMGSVFAVLQNVIDSVNYDNWNYLTGNLPKLLIALLSAVFTLFILFQVYCIYRGLSPRDAVYAPVKEVYGEADLPSTHFTALPAETSERMGKASDLEMGVFDPSDVSDDTDDDTSVQKRD